MTSFTVRPVAIGLLLALLALTAGELHGIAFGAGEDAIIASFRETALANMPTHGSEEKAAKAVEGGWKYLKRGHEHFMGLGAVSLALCLTLGLSTAAAPLKTVAAAAVGFGAFVYPLFWTLVALRTPAMGAHAAKESLALMAQAGAGLGFVGLLLSLAVTLRWIVGAKKEA
jgi:hypothetical protein